MSARRLMAVVPSALAFAALLAGCGDPMLWTRYRAERAAWRAGRAIERIQINPKLASPDDYARAEAAVARVVEHYPPDRYATAEALKNPYRADIARITGNAAVLEVRLREAQGRREGAAEAYARIIQVYAGVPAVVREALQARGATLLREDRNREAADAWRTLWERFPVVSEAADEANPDVLAAPFRAAEALDLDGAPREAEALLAGAARRMENVAGQRAGTPAAATLWEHAAEAESRAGDAEAAMRALQSGIAAPASDAERARMVMSLARDHLDRGDADSTLVYTAWALASFGPEVHTQAVLLGARALVAMGLPDSALTTLNAFLDGTRLGSDDWVRGRYERARILERQGVWEQARSEYRTIAAGAPTHVLAIEALVNIVRHHVAKHEDELARMEGRHALEAIDQVLGVSRDDSVQVHARRARGEVQLALGDAQGAYATWMELWRRYPGSAVAAAAGMDAAGLAAGRLSDRDGARALYAGLADRAISPEIRERAQAALKRLGGAPPGGTTGG